MRSAIRPFLAPAFGLVIFALALWLLHHALRQYHYRDIVHAIRAIPHEQVVTAALLALCSYACLTLHDVLAVRYAGESLAYRRIAFASFAGYSISNSVGFSFLSGGTVRYRFYSAWGVSAIDIARIIAFCAVTSWLGFGTLAGLALVIEPGLLAGVINLSPALLRAIGVIILSLVSSYVFACALRFGPVNRGGWEFSLPKLPLACAQIVISAVDHAFVAATLYMLLPAGTAVSYPAFAVVFVLALAGGMLSQVPGGVGVFESLVVTLLNGKVEGSGVIAALFAYRAIYYLLPLGASLAMIAAYEVRRRASVAMRLADALEQWLAPVVPQVLAFMVLLSGTVLLFSSVTPAVHARMETLRAFLPLPVVEASHFFTSIAGALLVFLARPVQRRVNAAYLVVLALLFSGGVFSLLKGIDYEEAFISFALLGILAPCRRYFYRNASLWEDRFSPQWTLTVLLVLGCVGWLTIFSYKHVDYSDELWWRFSFRGDVHRSLRAIAGVACVSLLVASSRLLRPARHRLQLPAPEEIQTAQGIIQESPSTLSALALLGDKSLLFNESRTAFIMYRVEGRSWIALGDPVGPRDQWVELIWRFRELSDYYGGWTVFYQVPAESLPYYLDLGLAPLKLGEEARVDLNTFTLEGGGRKAERNTLHKLEKAGVTFEILPAAQVPAVLAELRVVSDSWLAEKNAREKRFSIGYFDEEYLKQFPHAIVRVNGAITAFANVLANSNREEASIDLMRYAHDAPSGLMDFLFLHLLWWAKGEGYKWFNLGMAPLSGLENRPLAPAWNRLSDVVYRHGEHFYNFQGLRKYKDKFDPQWRARYLLSPGGFALPIILANVTTTISGGLTGALRK